MRIGMIGLGKLGYPVIKAIEAKGHEIAGFDNDTAKQDQDLWIMSPEELVNWADIVFIAVQTPHEPRFDGSMILPDERADFDYSYLISALKKIIYIKPRPKAVIAVISTCLPGTFNRDIKHLLPKKVSYVYNPMFIAMGSDASIAKDLYESEFNLIGVRDKHAADVLKRFYRTINKAPNLTTDITTAEAIKVSYNTFVTFKTVLANLWGEIAHKVGADVDDITKAWSLSTKRLLSKRYLTAGVADGGPCHPRDNIALSKKSLDLEITHNLFDELMKAREDHMEWLVRLTVDEAWAKEPNIETLIVLGKSFKPESKLENGSAGSLFVDILWKLYGVKPNEFAEDLAKLPRAVYFIATKHARYKKYKFPRGSVVVDPFRYIPDRTGVKVIRIGEGKK